MPGAQLIRSLRSKLRSSESTIPKKKKVIRTEKKQRNSPVLSREYRKVAMKAYSGTTGQKKSPAHVRRTKPAAWPPCDDDESAFAWLLSLKFVKTLSRCGSCGRSNVLGPHFSTSRECHWRCTPCGKRHPWLTQTIFEGLRVSPVELARLVKAYAQMPVNKAPMASSLCPLAGVGRTQDCHYPVDVHVL